MDVKAYNIVVLPDENVREQVMDWSRRISDAFETDFNLGDKYIPHMTIYQTAYPEKNYESILSTLENVSSELSPFEVEFNAFSPLFGFVFLDAVKTAELVNLHNTVVDELNPLREGNLFSEDIERLKDPNFPADFKESLRTYGFKAKDMYSPHITLTRLKNYDETESAISELNIKPLKFEVNMLYLSNVGENGTCNEIFEEFEFKKENIFI